MPPAPFKEVEDLARLLLLALVRACFAKHEETRLV